MDEMRDCACNNEDVRKLTEEEQTILARQDTRIVSSYKQQKLESEAQKNWDIFYKRNETRFYKDRHWTLKEFQELLQEKADENLGKVNILEVGCGVGNFMFPVIEQLENVYFYACDLSARAIKLVKDDARYSADRCTVFVSDVTSDRLTDHITQPVDVTTLIFVLSAIPPNKMNSALKNIFEVLRPGGRLLIRDYGIYDHAMFRFSPGSKLSERHYVRQDSTFAYYFSIEELNSMMKVAGFEVGDVRYVHRETVNHKKDLSVPRVFIQGTYIKPH